MFYKKALAFSVAAALALTVGCSSSTNTADSEATTEDAIVAPYGSTVTKDNVTVVNGEDLSEPPTEEEKITIRMGLLNGSASLSAAHLLENGETGVSYEKYSYTNYNTAEDVVSALENNEIDVATLPLNEAAKLYNKTESKYKVAMLNSMFNYCIAQNNSSIDDVSQLAGKTITVAADDEIGKIVIDKIIKDYNISGCTIDTVENTEAVINGLADGTIKAALTQASYISQAAAVNQNVTMALDLYDTWFDQNDADIVTGCLVASNDFITSNQKAFVYFMKDYEASVTLTRKNIDESSKLAAKYELAPSTEAARSAIPGSSISVKTGEDMISCANKYFNLINSIDTGAIGGIIPDINFYYSEPK